MTPDHRVTRVEKMLDGGTGFSAAWTAVGDKVTVPVASRPVPDSRLLSSIGRGLRACGQTRVLAAPLGARRVETILVGDGALALPGSWAGSDVVMTLPDMSGAVLMTMRQYALVSGPRAFVAACLACETEQAKADFARVARRLATTNPLLLEVAAAHPPRWPSWRTPAEVPPESVTRRKLSLIDGFVAGRLDVERFRHAWVAARREAMAAGERAHGDLGRLLDEAFHEIDDYDVYSDEREFTRRMTVLHARLHGMSRTQEPG
ncbi:hypothetical protein [Nonomuraea ferruginea]|uniref:Nucleotidyltransferase AbiEii toxin of type IV toxin-antitoxin system n=1 Tax=Nonomuraea ferruginea TaxID=46174 RepID=A0ABT4TC66_9ACTN|nr:hypothetical protein [Nonomuraea ferruginea]MDA0647083.1 hypothetical protein [Nonomuraea ferruginea]